MKAAAARRKRHWFYKLLIPAYLVLYIAMIPLNSVLETEHVEVFPFFSFELFSRVPDWHTTEYGLVVEAIDGQPVGSDSYLIPNQEVRDWKALLRAGRACAQDLDCDETVADIINPIIEGHLGKGSIDFRIVVADVDLRDVQDGLDDLNAGTVTRADFFGDVEVIGRWNTKTGRLAP